MPEKSQKKNIPKKISIRTFLLIAALAVFFLVGCVGIISSLELSGMRDYSEIMLTEHFPKVLEHQRTTVNIERLRRSAELVLFTENADIRRSARLSAQAMSVNTAFGLDPAVHHKIVEATDIIKEVGLLRDQGEKLSRDNYANQEKLVEWYKKIAKLYYSGHNRELFDLELGIIQFSFAVRKVKTEVDLAAITPTADRLMHDIATVRSTVCDRGDTSFCKHMAVADGLVREMFLNQKRIVGYDVEAYHNWKKADNLLRELSDSLTTTSSTTIIETLNEIIGLATTAKYRNYAFMACIYLIIFFLLLAVRRYMAQPIARVAQAIEDIRRGEPMARLTDSKISEISDLNNVITEFNQYMFEVREKSKILEDENQKLENLSFKDPLTGIYNRRYFNIATQREWSRAKRSRESVTILMLDVDFFKKYNDALGHIVGDSCLVSIAGAITSSMLRPSDIVARYGGEEFVMLVHNIDLNGALTIAERVHKNIAALQLAHPDSSISPFVTVSIGIASYVPMYYDPPELVVEQADMALYQAKKDGRNRTCVYDPAKMNAD